MAPHGPSLRALTGTPAAGRTAGPRRPLRLPSPAPLSDLSNRSHCWHRYSGGYQAHILGEPRPAVPALGATGRLAADSLRLELRRSRARSPGRAAQRRSTQVGPPWRQRGHAVPSDSNTSDSHSPFRSKPVVLARARRPAPSPARAGAGLVRVSNRPSSRPGSPARTGRQRGSGPAAETGRAG